MTDSTPSTRERIFEAAVHLFATNGYSGTSMRQLGRAVGIKESSLYNHFSGKEAILTAILDYYAAGFREALPSPQEMEQTASGIHDPVELWLIGVQQYMDRLPPLMEAIAIILTNEMYINEQIRTFMLEKMFVVQREATEMLLRDMSRRGLIRECDFPAVAAQYVYVLHGVNMEMRLQVLGGVDQKTVTKQLFAQMKLFVEKLK